MSDLGSLGPKPARMRRWRLIGLWAALILASVLAVVVLKRVEAPAALLLGPLLVGIAFGVAGVVMRPAKIVRTASQAVLGTVLGAALASAYTPAFALHLPVFVAIGLTSLGLAVALGWLVSRQGWIRGSTAIWGLTPGASAAMVTLAEANGGDVRIVGLMQYFRILMVATSALALAHLLVPGQAVHHAAASWFSPVDPGGTIAIVGLVMVGLAADRWTPVPAAALLVPSLVASAIHALGWAHIAPPPWLAAAAYAVVGWNIGLGFTRQALIDSARMLPRLVGITILFLILCALVAVPLILFLGVDPLTAYLSTSPGGVDSMIIIAASAPVDLPFILSAHTARFLLVVAFGPALVRAVVRRLG